MKQSHIIIIFIVCIILILFFIVCLGQRKGTYHIVVAKYKEDISWFFHMDLEKLYVYDKSGDEYSPFICLENKGREGSTFLGHIIEHYDNLPDYLVLVQGSPFAHMKPEINPRNFQENLDKLVEKKPEKTQPLFCDYWEEPTSFHPGLMIDKYYNLMFENKQGDVIRYATGNQYIIPRKDIQKRPKHFYQKLWKMAIKGDHYSHCDIHTVHGSKNKFDPSELIGWSLERIFPIIMSDTPVKKSFLEKK